MVLKSKDEAPPRPVVMALAILRPLNRVSLKEGPRPRTVIWVALPVEVAVPPSMDAPRVTVTPGMRCIAAAISTSGNLPMSSAEMASTRPPASRLMSRFRCNEPIRPVTVTLSTSLLDGAGCETAGTVAKTTRPALQRSAARSRAAPTLRFDITIPLLGRRPWPTQNTFHVCERMSPTAFGPDVRPKAPDSEKLYSAFADRFRLFWIANPGASGLAVLPISLTGRPLAPFQE